MEERRFFKSTSYYLFSNIACLIASIVSFPMITRILSLEEYGLLSLCNTTLLIAIAFSKLGIQNAITRYFGEIKENDKIIFYTTFYTTGFLSSTIIGVLIISLSIVFFKLKYIHLSVILSITILLSTEFSYLYNFLRINEKAKELSIITIFTRYFAVSLGIILIVYFNSGVKGIFLSQIYGYLIILLIIIFKLNNKLKKIKIKISYNLICKSLKFGFPLLFYEFSSIFLAFSDRYLITIYNGIESVGLYTAGYSICMYIGDLIRQPIEMAVTPMIYRIHQTKGDDETIKFIKIILKLVFLIAFPIFAGVMAINNEILVLIASEKYSQASCIVPWVLASMLLYAMMPMISAGLLINNKTKNIAVFSIFGAIINIILNLFLLKKYGFIAAAWSTAFAYFIIITLTITSSRKFLSLRWPINDIFIYLISSFAMYLIINNLMFGLNLFTKIISGILIYSILIFALDKEVRIYVKYAYEKLFCIFNST